MYTTMKVFQATIPYLVCNDFSFPYIYNIDQDIRTIATFYIYG